MSLLFEPKYIGKMKVKNRIVRSPAFDRTGNPDGKCTDRVVSVYRELARGGAGLIITGQIYVHISGKGLPNVTGLHNDNVIGSYKKLTKAAHVHDAKIVAQLGHSGPVGFIPDFTPLFAPSAVLIETLGISTREMTEEEIHDIIAAFGQAARRAKEAGFDGIEIHACHGDLIHSYLSPHTNLRKDGWGGSFEKRMQFLVKVYERAREFVGKDYPILVKINAVDHVEGGITIDLSKRIAEMISAKGFNAIEISQGTHNETIHYISRGDIPKNAGEFKHHSKERRQEIIQRFKAMKDEVKFKEAYLRPYAKEIKPVINIPLILPGGLRTTSVMEDVLRNGDADFVGLCRPLIRDPQFPNRIREGLKKSDCLNCNHCIGPNGVKCHQKFFRPPHF